MWSVVPALRVPVRSVTLAGGTALLFAAAELHTACARMAQSGAEANNEPPDPYSRYTQAWAHGVCRVLNVEIELSPARPPPALGARLVVANHRGPLDVPILLGLFGGSMVSRAYVADLPIMGPAARGAQTIFVDTKSKHSGAQAIRAMREQLQRGRTMTVFSEGNTSSGDEIQPFNAGAMLAARGLDVELIPVGLAHRPGTEFWQRSLAQHARHLFAQTQLPVSVVIGEPRRLEGSTRALSQALREEVAMLVSEARSNFDARWPEHTRAR